MGDAGTRARPPRAGAGALSCRRSAAVGELGDEGPPRRRAEDQRRPGRILGVPHADDARKIVGDLDARATVVAALAPSRTGQVHDPGASLISSKEESSGEGFAPDTLPPSAQGSNVGGLAEDLRGRLTVDVGRLVEHPLEDDGGQQRGRSVRRMACRLIREATSSSTSPGVSASPARVARA